MTIDCDEAFLAETLGTARAPLVLCGAGLSVASGVRPYRGGQDSSWSILGEEWATMEKFHENPQEWWETFWVPWQREMAGAVPNDGHRALKRIMRVQPALRVITQNIDGLDRAVGLPEERLIEIHGSAGKLICADDACGQPQPYPVHGEVGPQPRCPRCRGPARPLVLMFDEDYYAHSVYRAFQARTWLAEADCLLLVGTSVSTSFVAFAVQSGLGRRLPVLSINPQYFSEAIINVEPGYAEVALPRVAQLMEAG